MGIIKS